MLICVIKREVRDAIDAKLAPKDLPKHGLWRTVRNLLLYGRDDNQAQDHLIDSVINNVLTSDSENLNRRVDEAKDVYNEKRGKFGALTGIGPLAAWVFKRDVKAYIEKEEAKPMQLPSVEAFVPTAQLMVPFSFIGGSSSQVPEHQSFSQPPPPHSSIVQGLPPGSGPAVAPPSGSGLQSIATTRYTGHSFVLRTLGKETGTALAEKITDQTPTAFLRAFKPIQEEYDRKYQLNRNAALEAWQAVKSSYSPERAPEGDLSPAELATLAVGLAQEITQRGSQLLLLNDEGFLGYARGQIPGMDRNVLEAIRLFIAIHTKDLAWTNADTRNSFMTSFGIQLPT